MQGRKQRIKKNIFVGAVLLLAVTAVLYASMDRIVSEFIQFSERTISHYLNAQVNIGELESGLLDKISFKDLSVLDRKGTFLVFAERAYFNFRLFDALFKRYEYFNNISVDVRNAYFTKGDFRLPFKISEAKIYLAKGLLRIEELKGFLNNEDIPFVKGFLNNEDIPFEAKATISKFQEQNPQIEIYCRFLPAQAHKKIPFMLPTVIYLSGDAKKMMLNGFWDETHKAAFDIEGNIQLLNKNFTLVLLPRTLSAPWIESYINKNEDKQMSSEDIFKHDPKIIIGGDFSSQNRLKIKVGLEHLNLYGNNLLSTIFIETEYIPQQNLKRGRVYSSGSVLNYQPFPEFEGFFRLEDSTLKINSFKWSDVVFLSGLLNLKGQVSGNCFVLINNLNLAHFAKFYYPNWNAWGFVQGKVNLDIKSQQITTKGDIRFSEGALGPFQFKGGEISITGENNIIKLDKSRIYQQSGYVDLLGEVDLRKIGKPDFGRKLTMIQNQRQIEWQGWNISSKDGVSGISLDKGIDEKFSVGFNSYVNDPGIMSGKKYGEEFNLEYKLENNNSLKIRLKDNEELLGIERKLKF